MSFAGWEKALLVQSVNPSAVIAEKPRMVGIFIVSSRVAVTLWYFQIFDSHGQESNVKTPWMERLRSLHPPQTNKDRSVQSQSA